MNILQTVFQDDSSSSGDGSFSQVKITLFPIDLRLVDQLGDAIHWRHVLGSIYNENMKVFDPNYKFHHYDITLKIVTKQTSKEKYQKIMTKIWLLNLDKW